jgi:LmbE family N-acetylglucosaminyl deacetylase
MKLMFINAHFDDFEFTAAGTLLAWRKKLGDAVRAHVVVCTDGKAGHHFRTREETGRMRRQEQAASARIGGYEHELLTLPNGDVPREACLQPTASLLAALWKSIRDFEPDYLFSPPVVVDPLAGIHVDHVAVADAVRRVAYMINVPHAFTPEYPADETISRPCRTPVIINVYDAYMARSNSCGVVVDVEEFFPGICEMTWCHQSQISEWLPWVGRHDMKAPASLAEWTVTLRRRFEKKNQQLGIATSRACEVFTLTSWGATATDEQIARDFPARYVP